MWPRDFLQYEKRTICGDIFLAVWQLTLQYNIIAFSAPNFIIAKMFRILEMDVVVDIIIIEFYETDCR